MCHIVAEVAHLMSAGLHVFTDQTLVSNGARDSRITTFVFCGATEEPVFTGSSRTRAASRSTFASDSIAARTAGSGSLLAMRSPALSFNSTRLTKCLAAATQAAGSDLTPLLELCKPAPADRPRGDNAALARLIDQPAPAPGKAFDNLYFVGDKWVSAWAINTSQGIILIDALNSGKEAAKLIEGGLRHLGLNPGRIKYIVVTHGHGDHYGGATYLANKYHARVVALVALERGSVVAGDPLEMEAEWPS